MGTLTSYALTTAVILCLCQIAYRLCLERYKQPGFNRAVIVGIYIVSMLWVPAVWLFSHLFAPSTSGTTGVGEVEVFLGALQSEPMKTPGAPVWATVIVWIYMIGVVVTGTLSLVSVISVLRIIWRGRHISGDAYTIVVTANETVSPFTWGRYIVMSEADYLRDEPMILLHEESHRAHFHLVDLLLSQVVCVLQWFNPSAWLLRSELKMTHEYQADLDVLAQVDKAEEYQMMLLQRTVSRKSGLALVNNLNTSNLKKRIIMMKRRESGLRSRFGALALLPAMALAIGLVGTNTFAEVRSATEDVRTIMADNDVAAPETSGGESTTSEDKVFYEPEQIAEFPGGMGELMKWLSENVRYPKGEEVSGRVIVQFKIDADGRVSDPKIMRGLSSEADAEAIRLVLSMPVWKPGMINGKPVATNFTLPISFRLENSPKTAPKENNAPAEAQSMSLSIGDQTVSADSEGVRTNASTTDKKAPAYFVDGKQITGADLQQIDPLSIESMTVKNNDPAFPNGRVDIVLKK